MASAKIAVSLKKETVDRLDRLVGEGVYPSIGRSPRQSVAEAVVMGFLSYRCVV